MTSKSDESEAVEDRYAAVHLYRDRWVVWDYEELDIVDEKLLRDVHAGDSFQEVSFDSDEQRTERTTMPNCRQDCSLRYDATCANTGVRFSGAPHNLWACEPCIDSLDEATSLSRVEHET